MERVRSRFQGVSNVFRFNWHFYLMSVAFALLLFVAGQYFQTWMFYVFAVAALAQTAISLVVTFYVYDASGLYDLEWLNDVSIESNGKLLTLNAGFDETDGALRRRYPNADIRVFDFYDPDAHTEVSIKRARKFQGTPADSTRITASNIPVSDREIDTAFLIFSAHEIRSDDERVRFFSELKRVCKNRGEILVTEHVRDAANLFAYSVGAFHFLPRSVWKETFERAELVVSKEIKITAFVTTFVLKKNGDPS